MTTILIVEDSSFQRKVIKKALRSLGSEFIEAGNGADALALATGENPDCVTLDLGLPDMSGFDLLAALRDSGVTAPVVVLSADIQTSSRARCLELGARAVLQKPVNDQQLCAVVSDLLHSGDSG